MYTKQLQQLADKMNAFARARKPFFFMSNFLGTEYEILPLDEVEKNNVFFEFEKISGGHPTGRNTHNSLQTKKQPAQSSILLEKKVNPFSAYEKQFDNIKKEILFGNSYLCNLTTQTPIETDCSLRDIFESAKSKYKILYKNNWVCFSPETFVKIDYRGISTNPMKGTIDASIADAENVLMNDPKEIAEHYTIVDLLRNDLSIVAKNVEVQKFRYISRVETARGDLLQTSSKIVGNLEPDYLDKLGTIFCKLLPAGSISGAPKKKTIDIIKTTENFKRGFYTGVAGVFDGTKLDSCVLIRFIEKTENGLVYKSGGGITKYSEAEKEYEEVNQKIYVPTA